MANRPNEEILARKILAWARTQSIYADRAACCRRGNRAAYWPLAPGDLVGEIYGRLCRQERQWREERDYDRLFALIARRAAVDAFRKEQKQWRFASSKKDILRAQASGSSTPIDKIEYEEVIHRRDQIIRNMPPECQAVFQLRSTTDLSYDEIAELLGVKEAWAIAKASKVRKEISKLSEDV